MDESGFISAYGGSAGGGTSFADVVAYAIGILNSLVLVLSALALLFFMWAVFQYIYKAGNKQNRKAISWGLLALFVLFSIWGILRLACASFLGAQCGGSATSIVPQQFESTNTGGPSPGTPGGTGGLY